MWFNITRMPHFCIGFFTATFVGIWLLAWTLNAFDYTRFDLDSLRDMYIWLMTQLNATHAINSIWNSPRGYSPTAIRDCPWDDKERP